MNKKGANWHVIATVAIAVAVALAIILIVVLMQ